MCGWLLRNSDRVQLRPYKISLKKFSTNLLSAGTVTAECDLWSNFLVAPGPILGTPVQFE